MRLRYREGAEVVEETESRVELEAVADVSSQDDCADGATVCLDAPLGDRALIDGTTGDEVRVDVIADEDLGPECPD